MIREKILNTVMSNLSQDPFSIFLVCPKVQTLLKNAKHGYYVCRFRFVFVFYVAKKRQKTKDRFPEINRLSLNLSRSFFRVFLMIFLPVVKSGYSSLKFLKYDVFFDASGISK